MAANISVVTEGVLNASLIDQLDLHATSFFAAPNILHHVSSKTSAIGLALCRGIIDLLDHVTKSQNENKEDDTNTFGNENHLYHSCQYAINLKNDDAEFAENIEIRSLAPTIFHQLREDIGISNEKFRESFSQYKLNDFTNTGRSGSLMYKTTDQLFILKTLLDYEARLLLKILSGYHLRFRRHATILNRYVGLYSVHIKPPSSSTITTYVAITVNAFTPTLKINEIYDLKGSKIRRKVGGFLSTEKFLKLKDMNFTDLYPNGIRIPSNIYEKLKLIVANDSKALRKLNIMDYSFLLGIRHLDMTEVEMLERQKSIGLTVLMSTANSFVQNQTEHVDSEPLPHIFHSDIDLASLPYSYLKPLELLSETIDMDLYYKGDSTAHKTLPIPGIINGTNQRVYIYLALIDILQTFDTLRILDQTYRKIVDYDRHLEHSLIPSDDYEPRFNEFLFKDVFVDAKDDFPWNITDRCGSICDKND